MDGVVCLTCGLMNSDSYLGDSLWEVGTKWSVRLWTRKCLNDYNDRLICCDIEANAKQSTWKSATNAIVTKILYNNCASSHIYMEKSKWKRKYYNFVWIYNHLLTRLHIFSIFPIRLVSFCWFILTHSRW